MYAVKDTKAPLAKRVYTEAEVQERIQAILQEQERPAAAGPKAAEAVVAAAGPKSTAAVAATSVSITTAVFSTPMTAMSTLEMSTIVLSMLVTAISLNTTNDIYQVL
jgi:hypothetical protein